MEAWTKSERRCLKNQSKVIGTGCQTTLCQHTEQKEYAHQHKEGQRHMKG